MECHGDNQRLNVSWCRQTPWKMPMISIFASDVIHTLSRSVSRFSARERSIMPFACLLVLMTVAKRESIRVVERIVRDVVKQKWSQNRKNNDCITCLLIWYTVWQSWSSSRLDMIIWFTSDVRIEMVGYIVKMTLISLRGHLKWIRLAQIQESFIDRKN